MFDTADASERLAARLRDLGLATPALVMLGTVRPFPRLNGLALHFAAPFLETLWPSFAHETWGRLLGTDEGLEQLLAALHNPAPPTSERR